MPKASAEWRCAPWPCTELYGLHTILYRACHQSDTTAARRLPLCADLGQQDGLRKVVDLGEQV